MERIHSYPSIFNVGHKQIEELFEEPVVIQEKVDGSQFSFGIDENGQLFARSKGQQLVLDAPEKMFNKAVETIKALAHLLVPGWVYRGEFLQSPHHNTLTYSRVPMEHIILFDVETALYDFLSPEELFKEAVRIGLESVPYFGTFNLRRNTPEERLELIKGFLSADSILGGVKIEGVVIKNYHRFGADKKPMYGKYVAEGFKEMNKVAFRVANPTQSDVVQNVIDTYKVDARWRKAIQHLRDAGELTGTPQDIGKLMKEVPADILKEAEQEIKDALFEWAWPKISRGITAGLPQWYKEQLALGNVKVE